MKNFIEVNSNKKSLLINVEAIVAVSEDNNNGTVIHFAAPYKSQSGDILSEKSLNVSNSYNFIKSKIAKATGGSSDSEKNSVTSDSNR